MIKRVSLILALVVTVAGSATVALASTSVTLKGCGSATVRGDGKVEIYPWHVTCANAKKFLPGTVAPHAVTYQFTADGADTGDAYAVKINGRWWVCGGKFGNYFCGYPYRADSVIGGTTWKGPFTEEIGFQACSFSKLLCKKTVKELLPGTGPGGA